MFQQYIIISKSATMYHCSSTMVYEIGQALRFGKKYINQLDNTTHPYSAPSTPSSSYYKFNKTLTSLVKIMNCRYTV